MIWILIYRIGFICAHQKLFISQYYVVYIMMLRGEPGVIYGSYMVNYKISHIQLQLILSWNQIEIKIRQYHSTANDILKKLLLLFLFILFSYLLIMLNKSHIYI